MIGALCCGCLYTMTCWDPKVRVTPYNKSDRAHHTWNPGHVALSLIFITWMYSPGETCQRPWSTGASWAIVKG